MKCSKCDARQTWYCYEFMFFKAAGKNNWDVNPEYAPGFFNTAKTEPFSNFCHPPKPQFHDCPGLSTDEAGEEVYQRSVLASLKIFDY